MDQSAKLQESDVMQITDDLTPEEAEQIGIEILGVKVKITAVYLVREMVMLWPCWHLNFSRLDHH